MYSACYAGHQIVMMVCDRARAGHNADETFMFQALSCPALLDFETPVLQVTALNATGAVAHTHCLHHTSGLVRLSRKHTVVESGHRYTFLGCVAGVESDRRSHAAAGSVRSPARLAQAARS